MILTGFAGGNEGGQTRRSSSDLVDGYGDELVVGIGAEVPHVVVHRRYPGYFRGRLVRIFRLVLKDVVRELLRALVGPGQFHRLGRYVGHLDVLRCQGQCWNENTLF